MRRFLLCVALVVLLAGSWSSKWVNAAGKNDPQAAASQDAGTAGSSASGYVGSDACAICHADVVKSFATNPHLALRHPGSGVTCEKCHGPGKAHVDSGGDITKIFRFSTASPKQIDAKCLSCHAGVHPNYARSPHGQAGVSCTDCHSNHASLREASRAPGQPLANFIRRDNIQSAAGAAFLLKASQPQLCYQCHSDVKPAFSQPFHHQVNEGLMRCTDCHDPHGTFQPNQLRATADQNAICTKCHSENAGPFVYEHPVVKTEGCTACHSPHGSPSPRLLNVSNVNTLCLQCHSASMDFHPPGAPSFHNQSTQYVSCTTCHTQIHGSNASSVFFR